MKGYKAVNAAELLTTVGEDVARASQALGYFDLALEPTLLETLLQKLENGVETYAYKK